MMAPSAISSIARRSVLRLRHRAATHPPDHSRAPMVAPSAAPGASSPSSQPSSESHGLLPDLSWDPRLRRVSLRSRVLSLFC
jgi:hypothetical protein